MSLNDPRWGNQQPDDDNRNNGRRPGNNEGPPDLEEVWRDTVQKISTLLGGKKNNGGRSGGPSGGEEYSFRQFGIMAVIVVAIVAAFWLKSSVYIVRANEQGVELLLGKYLRTTEPGLHFHLPYPLASHELVDYTGVRTVTVGYLESSPQKPVLEESLMVTKDMNIIDLRFAVQYVLKDAKAYLFNSLDPESSVKLAAESAMREIVGKNNMDFLLNQGREEVASNAQQMIQAILDRYGVGIEISRVNIQDVQAPEQVQEAFADVVKAGQDQERLRNQGIAYRNDVIPRAEGEVARIREQAQAYRERVVARAEGNASRFEQIHAAIKSAPEIGRERIYLETMENILGRSNKIMLDVHGSGNNNVMLLPLDRMMQQAAGGSVQKTEAGQSGVLQPIQLPPPGPSSGATATDRAAGGQAVGSANRHVLTRERGVR